MPHRVHGRNSTVSYTVGVLNKFCNIVIDCDPTVSIGLKRTRMLMEVETEYFCFIDDDDLISEEYYSRIEPYLGSYDIVSFNVKIIKDGAYPPQVKAPGTKRYPINHLCVTKTCFGHNFHFGDYGRGEDSFYSYLIGVSNIPYSIVTLPTILYTYEQSTYVEKEYDCFKPYKPSALFFKNLAELEYFSKVFGQPLV